MSQKNFIDQGCRAILSASLVCCWSLGSALAEETRQEPRQDSEEATESLIHERVRVVGSAEKAKELPGSVHFLDEEELARHEYTDVHRVLHRVPGVYVQDEEGYGLRPNIGLRGSGVERSQKVTLMEDGVLIAPAPYTAPSAYYFPSAGRMESLEVSKGPSSIRQGPFTTGGVLNLISRSIPRESFSGDAELALGEDDHLRGKLRVGGTRGSFGWSLETFQQQTDGFKDLDGGGDTGFDIEDYVGKLRYETRPDADTHHSLELKLGATDQEGDETYLGLTQADFDDDPFRRYAASSEDVFDSDHDQVQLRHFMAPSSWLDLTTTVYYNDFFRNWHKLEKVGCATPGGCQSVSKVLADPGGFAGLMDTLRGDADSAPDDLAVRNNRREYYSRGVQSVLGLRFDGRSTRHEVEIGVRYHEDEEDRFQEEELFQMLDGVMRQTGSDPPGSNANRISEAEALAVFVQDTIRWGDHWTVTPGVRLESVDFEQRNFGTSDPDRTGSALVVAKNDVDEIIPGVGVDYRFNPSWRVFAGIHKGFAPPGPGKDEATDPEESVNYELGMRFGRESTSIQTVAFYNDYDNLLGTDTTSGGGGGTGETFNGGAAEVSGFELSLTHDFGKGWSDRHSIPFQLAYTYTTSEFESSFTTKFADWAPEVTSGDEIPYIPPHQIFAEIGWRMSGWGVFLNGGYVDEMRTRAGQGSIDESERIEDHLVFDASAEYGFGSRYRAFVQLRNLTDREYVAARRPAGLRPGLPRTALFGFGVQF